MRIHSFLLLSLVLSVSPSLAQEYKAGVTAKVVLKTTTMSNGQKIEYLKTENPEVTAMTVDFPPGSETGWHMHPVPVYAWLVSGSLTVEFEGGKMNSYKEGDAIVEVVNVLHNGRNPGKVPARLLVFYTGAEGTQSVKRKP